MKNVYVKYWQILMLVIGGSMALPAYATPIYHINFCGTYTDGSGGGVDGCIFYDTELATDLAQNFGILPSDGAGVITKIISKHPIFGNATFTFDELVGIVTPTTSYLGVGWPEPVKGWHFLDSTTLQQFLAVFPIGFVDNPFEGAEIENDYLTLISANGIFAKDKDKVRLREVAEPATLVLIGISMVGLGWSNRKKIEFKRK